MVASEVHMGITCSIDTVESDSDAEKNNTQVPEETHPHSVNITHTALVYKNDG